MFYILQDKIGWDNEEIKVLDINPNKFLSGDIFPHNKMYRDHWYSYKFYRRNLCNFSYTPDLHHVRNSPLDILSNTCCNFPNCNVDMGIESGILH